MELFTYQKCIKTKDVLSFQTSEEIYQQIVETANMNDSDFQELWADMMKAVVKYANTRSQWHTEYSREQRIEKDSARTGTHDSVITNINIISRYLDKQGKDISWRKKIGDDRKRIGDFACYLAYVYSLNSR